MLNRWSRRLPHQLPDLAPRTRTQNHHVVARQLAYSGVYPYSPSAGVLRIGAISAARGSRVRGFSLNLPVLFRTIGGMLEKIVPALPLADRDQSRAGVGALPRSCLSRSSKQREAASASDTFERKDRGSVGFFDTETWVTKNIECRRRRERVRGRPDHDGHGPPAARRAPAPNVNAGPAGSNLKVRASGCTSLTSWRA